jgi:DUF2950 family protein
MTMLQLTPSPDTRRCHGFTRAFTPTILFLALTAFALAQQVGQKHFASPEDASQALFSAAQSGNSAELLAIFGPGGSQIISSGDPVQDANTRQTFLARFKEMHRLANEPDGSTTLYIGAENWPVPIPLINKSGAWYFDTNSGKKEILYRRIGANELNTISVLHALVDAQNEYRSEPRDGKHPQYALTFVSDQGKHNGLYWKTAQGEPESPIGPLVADAAAEGYKKHAGQGPSPFHGYFYRILTAQGKSAPGGTRSYIDNGQMTGGFALLAYPADYRSSGVMTFIVSRDGVISEKDLGPKTGELAKAMNAYAPDKTWHKAE